MKDNMRLASLAEQEICVECGMCCDGTLFLHAHLSPGERGHLPERIEKNSYTREGKDYFRLPCEYFDKKCTIYDQQKAEICSSFRCQLLNDFAAGKVFLKEAVEIVRSALQMRAEILEHYSRVSGVTPSICFMKLLRELGKNPVIAGSKIMVGNEYDLLLARSNIFEALLIRYFRSSDDFEKMMKI